MRAQSEPSPASAAQVQHWMTVVERYTPHCQVAQFWLAAVGEIGDSSCNLRALVNSLSYCVRLRLNKDPKDPKDTKGNAIAYQKVGHMDQLRGRTARPQWTRQNTSTLLGKVVTQ